MSLKKPYTISLFWANVLNVFLALPIAFLFVAPFSLIWGSLRLLQGIGQFLSQVIPLIIILITGIVVHEWLHAIAWRLAGNLSPDSIKFGFQWKTLTPYAHSQQPMEVQAYRWGIIMPGLVLGIIPGLSAILFGNGWSLAFGIFFTWAAGGDLIVLWLLRNVPAGKMVEDHPSEAGCYVLDES